MSAHVRHHVHGRRGAVAAGTAIFMVLLLSCTALSVDIGFRCVTRAQLQNAADAAALAGATAYSSDVALAGDKFAIDALVRTRASKISAMNYTIRKPTILEADHLKAGVHDWDKPSSPLSQDGRWNAAHVVAHRTKDSVNGPVPYFFAPIFGRSEGNLTATARAAMDDRVVGYRIPPDGGGFLPFTINENLFKTLSTDGPDEWSYNGQEVLPYGDGVPEVRLFPWCLFQPSEEGSDLGFPDRPGRDAAGNFGTLNIGIYNVGAAELEAQIRNGLTAEQMENEFGTSELRFFADDGTPVTYPATGNPGLNIGVADAINALKGKVVGFFTHRQVVDPGANALFEITGIRFGRIVEVSLTGAPDRRVLAIQPVAYTGPGVMTGAQAPSSGGHVGRLLLVW